MTLSQKEASKTPKRGGKEARILGTTLRKLRVARHLTQAELAERAELDPKYIGLVESGKTNISLPNLLSFCRGLSLPAGKILLIAFPPESQPKGANDLLNHFLQLIELEEYSTVQFMLAVLNELKKLKIGS